MCHQSYVLQFVIFFLVVKLIVFNIFFILIQFYVDAFFRQEGFHFCTCSIIFCAYPDQEHIKMMTI